MRINTFRAAGSKKFSIRPFIKSCRLISAFFIITFFSFFPGVFVSSAMEGKIFIKNLLVEKIPSLSIALTDSDNRVIFSTQSNQSGMFSINTDKLSPSQKSDWAHKRLKLNIFSGYKGTVIYRSSKNKKALQLLLHQTFDPMQEIWDFNITLSKKDLDLLTRSTSDIETWYKAVFGTKSDFGLFPGIYREHYQIRASLLKALSHNVMPVTPLDSSVFIIVNNNSESTSQDILHESGKTWIPEMQPFTEFLLTKQLLSAAGRADAELLDSLSWAIAMDIHDKPGQKTTNLLTSLKSFGKKNSRSKSVIRSLIYLKLLNRADISLKSQKLLLLYKDKKNLLFKEPCFT